jgi:uncharacterized damage-inducible protein DinB
MAAPVSQTHYRAKLLEANRAVIARIRESVSTVPPTDIHRKPPAGGWSIGEVLEHLIVSADSYLDTLRSVLARTDLRAADAGTTWKPSFMGGLLTASLRSDRKLPAPRLYKPGPEPREGVLAEFLRRQEEVGRLLGEAGTVDWRHATFTSPVSRLMRMNVGDALSVLVVHAERHAAQIDRVKAAISRTAVPSMSEAR